MSNRERVLVTLRNLVESERDTRIELEHRLLESNRSMLVLTEELEQTRFFFPTLI